MKRKKFSKRLVLNKKTVANLDAHQLNGAKGGATGISDCIVYETCPGPTVIACPSGYNCTTQNPNEICLNTCNTCNSRNTGNSRNSRNGGNTGNGFQIDDESHPHFSPFSLENVEKYFWSARRLYEDRTGLSFDHMEQDFFNFFTVVRHSYKHFIFDDQTKTFHGDKETFEKAFREYLKIATQKQKVKEIVDSG